MHLTEKGVLGGSQAAPPGSIISHLGWESFRYIARRLSIATSASWLIGVHRQVPEVSEIKRLKLLFRNDFLIFLISSHAGEGHG